MPRRRRRRRTTRTPPDWPQILPTSRRRPRPGVTRSMVGRRRSSNRHRRPRRSAPRPSRRRRRTNRPWPTAMDLAAGSRSTALATKTQSVPRPGSAPRDMRAPRWTGATAPTKASAAEDSAALLSARRAGLVQATTATAQIGSIAPAPDAPGGLSRRRPRRALARARALVRRPPRPLRPARPSVAAPPTGDGEDEADVGRLGMVAGPCPATVGRRQP